MTPGPRTPNRPYIRPVPTYEYFEPRHHTVLHTGQKVTLSEHTKCISPVSAIRHFYDLNPHSPDWGFHKAKIHVVDGVDGATIQHSVTGAVVGVFVRRAPETKAERYG